MNNLYYENESILEKITRFVKQNIRKFIFCTGYLLITLLLLFQFGQNYHITSAVMNIQLKGNEPDCQPSGFLDHINEGSMISSAGMPLLVYKDICLSKTKFTFIGKTAERVSELEYCCLQAGKEYQPYISNCSMATMSLCNLVRAKGDFEIDVKSFEAASMEGYTWFSGSTFWYYTHNTVERIGHAFNRMLHFFNLAKEPNFADLTRLVSARSPPPTGEHIKQFYQTILSDYSDVALFSDNVKKLPQETACFEKLVEVDYSQNERLFFNEEQGEQWRHTLHHQFHLDQSSKCAPPRAVVLQRNQGSGMRRILNYDVLERVFRKNGIFEYENVTVSGDFDMKGHMDVFSNFGLMVASHSSQLKNLMFAPRYAGVIEARGTPAGYMQPSPFSYGMKEIGVIFEESVGHKSDHSSCPESHGCKTQKKYKTDYWLDEEIFDKTVKSVLRKQREYCDDIWSQSAHSQVKKEFVE